MTRKSTIVWIVGAIVVVGGGTAIAASAVGGSHDTVAATPGPGTAVASPTSTGAPATDASSPAVSDPASPASSSAPSSSASASPTTKPVVTVKNVTPHLTYYDWTAATTTLEVGGNVPGLVDAGGSCTVTATRGAVTVTQSFPASAQASSTECGTMSVVSSKLSPGTWNLTIGYRSPRAAGTSTTTEVTL